jgi:predicted NUDIX family phosphoesterase
MSQVLVVKKEDFIGLGFSVDGHQVIQDKGDLFTLGAHLEEREECETDESLLQIIPYITLRDPETDRIFVYTRGKQNGDARLTGKCSIGLGGHVELEPNTTFDFLDIVAMEAARELIEETNLTEEDHLEIVTEIIGEILAHADYRLLYTDIDAVSRVHLGVAFEYLIDSTTLTGDEENIITDVNWLTKDEIREMDQSGTIELEQWSRMVLSL